jgi:outer membrane protein OmpA-like peptidoglycan-associated protein
MRFSALGFSLFALALTVQSATAADVAGAERQPLTTHGVFFNSDSAVLNMEALDAVQLVYDVTVETGMTQVRITGHTDTAENSVELSRERAETVARHLVGHGFDPDNIEVEAMGANDLLKETGPGVSEQENRRVIVQIGN